MNTLPQAFVDRMARQLGDELPAFLRCYEAPYLRALRFNPCKPLPAEALETIQGLGALVPWEPTARYLSVDSNAGAVPLHEAGAYYLQEPSAMVPVAALDPRPGEHILDLCAAPGGKTTQIAGRMLGEGLLVCNEPVTKRAQVLSRNVERMGVTNALVISDVPERLASRWAEGFDAVLVDAPCSGEGMFRRHPEARDEWTPESPAGCARRQADILDSAAQLVRPGGRLVYSTCTLNPMENEDTVTAFCLCHPDFVPEAFSAPGADAPTGMLTCYPHRMAGEGQFVARLRRQGDAEATLPLDTSLPRPDRPRLTALRAFAPDAPMPTALLGDTLVSLPNCPDVRGIRVLRMGIHLGTLKGKIFQPDHAWAMTPLAPTVPRVSLTESEASLYQTGEALPVPEPCRGWVLPTLYGLPLGWGKVSDGIMKNHYPKGLRR